ncbi:MAG TPA: GTP-binding protein, partial [Planctomycetes bacterium]|nr:GTP-binding protein [Planctomycetota bacterium]
MNVHRVMIGTAGHIDHGKSSLVRALTGVDPDQLKEEKERGLTIDMGRSVLELPGGGKAGIIDVPGHEKFIKNMVAGSTSVAVALLVIAADDGVMPQTREHLEILSLLGVRKCVVALTKVDLVDPELRELARQEAASFLEGTPYAGSPVIPVSSVTGEGIEEIRRALAGIVGETPPPRAEGLFRLPVQRVFRKEGFGSVLGGVPVAGRAKKGDLLEVLPG